MKKIISMVLAVAVAGAAFAADTATQTVTYTVSAINDITVSGAPVLTLSALTTDGSAFEPATDTASYSLFTNSDGMKITAALDLAMPAGVTLELSMNAPTDATSVGSVVLSTTAADMVTGISKVSEQDLVMTYTLNAAVTADAVADATRTVTFTILDSAL